MEATCGYNQRLLTWQTAITFSIAAALAVLPTFLLLGRMGPGRLGLPPSSRDRRLPNRRRLDSLARQRHLLQGASRALRLALPLRGALYTRGFARDTSEIQYRCTV